jgi:hypothetical protein
MENYNYGNEKNKDMQPQTQKEAEKSCEDHAKAVKDMGMPKNIGNAYKDPVSPMPREQKLEDNKTEDKSLTEGKKKKYMKKQMIQDDAGLVGNQDELDVDGDGEIEGEDLAKLRAKKKNKKEVAMESRVEALEESLATLLTNIKTLISEGYGKKMTEAEGPSDKELKDIEKEEKPQHHKTAVGAQGAAADEGDDVPVGKRGEGETQKLGKVLKNVTDPNRRKELKMKARGHKLTKKQMKSGIKKKKQMTKQEIDQAVQDS